jgi:hypothetical protein
MANWIQVGDITLNVENITYVRRISPALLELNMTGGEKLEITENMAVNLWNWIESERLPFYDTTTQTRDFSGT